MSLTMCLAGGSISSVLATFTKSAMDVTSHVLRSDARCDEQRIAKISRVDVKLDLLLKHAGIEYDPFKALPRDVAEALRNRQKIQAIKLYRNATGVALKDAKDFIEEAQRRAGDA